MNLALTEISLWSLNQKLVELMARFDDYELAGEPLPEELSNELKAYCDLQPAKIDNCVKYHEGMDIMLNGLKEQKKKISMACEFLERGIDRYEAYLLCALKSSGQEKLSGNAYSLSIAKSTSVKVLNDFEIPIEYQKQSVSISVDRAAILKKLRAGEAVSGCALETRERLKIK
jgi:hypothetical protein